VILRRLQLKDFRQFRGEHDLTFAFDADRNVTLITGVNGAGKTALFYALNWVLYGEASALPGLLMSKAAIIEDAHPSGWVQLHFLHEGGEFVARREIVRTPAGSEREENFTLQELLSGGRVRPVGDPESRLNVILPRDARRYFFFDGERIDELSRPGHEKEVKDAVRSVLKLKMLERAAEHLEDVAREYSRALKEQGELDAEEVRLIEREEAYSRQVTQRETDLQDVKERVDILRSQLEQARAKLGALGEIRQLQQREREAEGRVIKLETEQSSISDLLQRAVNEGSAVLALGAVQRASALLEEKRDKGEIPSGLRQQFVEDLLRSGLCICGRPLDEPSRSELQRRHHSATTSALIDTVMKAAGELRGLEVRAETASQRLVELVRRRQGIHEERLELDRELEGIASRRGTEFSEDVAQLEEARRLIERRHQETLLQQGRLEAEIQRDSKQLEMARVKISQIKVRTDASRNARSRYEIASQAAQAAKHMIGTFSTDMRAQIQEATDQIFKGFLWKQNQVERVRLTDDYRLEVEDRFRTTALAGLSAGERQVLSLAFIAGMSRVTGEEAPLVIDTPFGRLSEVPITNVVKTLPGIAKQLVLFVTDRELDSPSHALLADRIGNEYTLKFDDETGQTSIAVTA
jgi:DNA sulfur modification protein DndD